MNDATGAPPRIRAAMTKQHMTQAELAKRLGISASYLSDILKERRALTARVALNIEMVLGLDAAKLLYVQAAKELERVRREQHPTNQ